MDTTGPYLVKDTTGLIGFFLDTTGDNGLYLDTTGPIVPYLETAGPMALYLDTINFIIFNNPYKQQAPGSTPYPIYNI